MFEVVQLNPEWRGSIDPVSGKEHIGPALAPANRPLFWAYILGLAMRKARPSPLAFRRARGSCQACLLAQKGAFNSNLGKGRQVGSERGNGAVM